MVSVCQRRAAELSFGWVFAGVERFDRYTDIARRLEDEG
jgi:hypothetical protein